MKKITSKSSKKKSRHKSMRKWVALCFLVLVTLLTLMVTRQSHNLVQEAQTIVTPTLYCLGACPTEAMAEQGEDNDVNDLEVLTPEDGEQQPVTDNEGLPTEEDEEQPTEEETQPCPATDRSLGGLVGGLLSALQNNKGDRELRNDRGRWGHHHYRHRHHRDGGGLMEAFLRFFMQLLQIIFQLPATPTNPPPSTNDPCEPGGGEAQQDDDVEPTTEPDAPEPTSANTAMYPTTLPTTPPGMRVVPDPLYGVTVDDVANIANIVNSSKNFSHMPTTRIVFDDGVAASYYLNAVNQIQPVSYIMGELLDSEGLAKITLSQYHARVASYLAALGNKVDIWEVGNEVNGNWTGPYPDVSSKIYDAYKQVKAAGKRSELTLWYNDGCGNGPSELDPIAFSQQYVPADMRNGLDYVLVSYYESQCDNIRPTAAKLTTFFNNLHALYPNARLGIGEIGFPNKVGTNTTAAISMINYYYGLKIPVPGYIGGYFWWYYYEDMLPYTTKPLWQTLNSAFNMEASALRR